MSGSCAFCLAQWSGALLSAAFASGLVPCLLVVWPLGLGLTTLRPSGRIGKIEAEDEAKIKEEEWK